MDVFHVPLCKAGNVFGSLTPVDKFVDAETLRGPGEDEAASANEFLKIHGFAAIGKRSYIAFRLLQAAPSAPSAAMFERLLPLRARSSWPTASPAPCPCARTSTVGFCP